MIFQSREQLNFVPLFILQVELADLSLDRPSALKHDLFFAIMGDIIADSFHWQVERDDLS